MMIGLAHTNHIRQRKISPCVTKQAHQLILQIFGGMHYGRVTILAIFMVIYKRKLMFKPASISLTLS